jgi:hypothetical protein
MFNSIFLRVTPHAIYGINLLFKLISALFISKLIIKHQLIVGLINRNNNFYQYFMKNYFFYEVHE